MLQEGLKVEILGDVWLLSHYSRFHSFRLRGGSGRKRFINFRRGEGKLVPRGLAKFNVK
ncbi:MAG: hypothetical protein ACTS4W_01485 [Candidatus Hodgkinia cicadicola]